MISSTILKKFVRSLIYSKGHNTVKSICEDLYYDKDYLPRVFKQISHRSAQNYMNYCRIIFVLYDFINGNNISSTRKKYHYTENALNKALHTYNLPSIRVGSVILNPVQLILNVVFASGLALSVAKMYL